jgi:hypothetical protein
VRKYLLAARAWWLWRQALAGQMLDRNTGGNNLVNWLLQAIFCLTATTTYTPGTGGPSAKLVTPPFRLYLMTAVGSNTANGTQATSGNCPGYTAAGVSLGSPAFGNPSAGIILGPSGAAVSWTATANWTAIAGVEVWDSAGTPLRYLFGSLSGGSVTVNNGNTLQFAISSLSFSGASW